MHKVFENNDLSNKTQIDDSKNIFQTSFFMYAYKYCSEIVWKF